MKKISVPNNIQEAHQHLVNWFTKNQRNLPWRLSTGNTTIFNAEVVAYPIWISEVMLQQTTVMAVIPYFNKFLKRFPTLDSLAEAPLDDVLEYWAGLGYYSRARNLHKSAQILAQQGFPKTANELIQFPGFGPYTSRAVASIAFHDPVGVLDGNVIRVLSRYFSLKIPWWNKRDKDYLQDLADQFAMYGQPAVINQALMELGATVCTPQNPSCLLCPIQRKCAARLTKTITELPLKKPRQQKEVWIWQPEIHLRENKVALQENNHAPFLKKALVFPGSFHQDTVAPSAYSFKHMITHHEIYVRPGTKLSRPCRKWQWVNREDLAKVNPSSLLRKTLESVTGC